MMASVIKPEIVKGKKKKLLYNTQPWQLTTLLATGSNQNIGCIASSLAAQISFVVYMS
jgi:hypothetical protein